MVLAVGKDHHNEDVHKSRLSQHRAVFLPLPKLFTNVGDGSWRADIEWQFRSRNSLPILNV